jgi:hypothetical protein
MHISIEDTIYKVADITNNTKDNEGAIRFEFDHLSKNFDHFLVKQDNS